MNVSRLRIFSHPILILSILIMGAYYQFFIQGKIPLPADTLVGAYYPWLDYKWGFPVGVPVKNPPISDIFSQFVLWKYLAVDMISQGHWPLWNPYSFSGTPLLATYHSAVLFPGNILLFLPRYTGWGLYIFAQTLVAALGLYFLSGKYTSSSLGRVVGSLVFAFSGLMTTWTEFGTGVWAAAMIPWIFYFVLSFLETSKTRYLTLLTLTFGSLFLAGHAQLTLYSSVLFGFFLIFLKITHSQYSLKRLLMVALSGIGGLALAAVQLVPAASIVKSTVREIEAYSATFNYGLSPVYELVRLWSADFFGNPTTYNHWDTQSFHEQSSFLGTLTLPLLLPLLRKKYLSSGMIFWGVVFVISIFLAVDNPLTRAFYSLPLPFLTYSSASRIFFLTSLSAGILTALAISYWQTRVEFILRVRQLSLVLLIIFALTTFIIGVLIYKPEIFGQTISLNMTANLKVTVKNSILPLTLLGGLVASTYLGRWKRVVIIFIAAAIFLDLGRYFLKYNPFVPSSLVFPTTPVQQYLQNQPGWFRISRADPEVLPPNTWMAYKLYSIEGYDPMALHDYAAFFNRLNGTPYEGRLSRYVEVSKYPSNFLNALNTKYLLAVKRDDDGKIPGDTVNKQLAQSPYQKIFEDKNTVVYFNPQATERVYFAPKVTSVNSHQELVDYLNRADFNPAKEAVIENGQKFFGSDTEGEVKIVDYKANQVIIKSSSPKSQFVVLADSYEDGWKLIRNNHAEPLYEVNGALRGMFVPAGENEIKLIYGPKSFDTGLKISIFALVVLILINVYAFKRKVW